MRIDSVLMIVVGLFVIASFVAPFMAYRLSGRATYATMPRSWYVLVALFVLWGLSNAGAVAIMRLQLAHLRPELFGPAGPALGGVGGLLLMIDIFAMAAFFQAYGNISNLRRPPRW